jgi:hypothetical protein
MKRNSMLVAFTVVFLLVGSALAASTKHSSKATPDMRISGTVVSSSSSALVVSSKIKGKEEQETFVVNPETKTKGTLAAGERVLVHYKNDSGQKIATMISAHKMKTAKSK